MKLTVALAILIASAVSASAITIDTIPVGDAGNPNDPSDGDANQSGVQNFGAVGYTYRIGKHEVTVGQYTAFLNAVAATDTYGLYDTGMATDLNSAGIAQSGFSGNYAYSVIGSPNHPVTYVNWGDAARFVNWLHNDQPTGQQDNTTTEDGTYTLNGATSNAALIAVSRNANAKWFIPSEGEWYKAAFYQPASQGGDSDGYWTYAVRTNTTPFSDQPPGATPDNSRVANFYSDDGVANGYNDGNAVTGAAIFDSSQNYLTDVGAYTSSLSFYGTFDQEGNVREWTEGTIDSKFRVVRASSWSSPQSTLGASNRAGYMPTGGLMNSVLGFRIASPIPEPSSALLALSIFALRASCRSRH
jgi:formylglycine-generating enzyme required for sulfatase activity